MSIFVYCRVSTQLQHFAQQMQDIRAYFDAHGIDINKVKSTVEEKESGGTSYTDRKFQQLLNSCEPGDIIYAASTDRLGRNFTDMIRLMEDAKQRGVTIVACKQGLSLDDNSMATKIILSILTIMDEDERMRIKHRVKNGVTAAINDINNAGYRITKKGSIQKHWGNAKGCDMTEAQQASVMSKRAAKVAWQNESPAFQWVREKLLGQMSRNDMLAELQALYQHAPDKFCTRNGGMITRSVLDHWCRQII